MVSELDKELIQYLVQLNEPQKRSLLAMMKSFLNNPLSPESDKQSIEQYNNELQEAMKRIDRGDFITLETLKADMQSW